MNILQTLRTVVQVAFAAASISGAHYIGFVESVPPQIVIVGGLQLGAGVTATFLFFLVACAIFARLFAQAIDGAFVTIDVLGIYTSNRIAKLGAGTLPSKTTQIRRLRSAIAKSSSVAIFLQATFFSVLIYWSYLRPPVERPHHYLLLLAGMTMAGLVVRLELLVVSPRMYLNRVLAPKRGKNRWRIAKQSVLSVIALAVLGAYIAGQARMKHLLTLPTIEIKADHFQGHAQIIANVGSLYLLHYADGMLRRFVLFDEHAALSIDYQRGVIR